MFDALSGHLRNVACGVALSVIGRVLGDRVVMRR
jgi:hypothetical protein